MDLPYSAVSVRSRAASSCPTSTETPWVWEPPVMEPRSPPTACVAPPPIRMPSTSWAAIPATLETTLSEMLVLPRSVCSGLLLPCSLMYPLLSLMSLFFPLFFAERCSRCPACNQPVDREQYDRAQSRRQDGSEAEAACAPADTEEVEHPAPDKSTDDPDQNGDYYACRVRPRHYPLRQDARYQADDYPANDGPDAYSHSPPHLHSCSPLTTPALAI